MGVSALLAAGVAGASHAPPWLEAAGDLRPGIRSARILLADQPILTAPYPTAPRRGTVARDVYLPIFATRRGDGCRGLWYQVGTKAWVCEEAVDLSSAPPIEAGKRVFEDTSDGLPFRYFFVGPGGSQGYKRVEAVDIGEPDFTLQPGFAVAITAERNFDGSRYGRTDHNLWVPMRDLGAVHALAFQGESIPDAPAGKPFPTAWVIVDHARVLTKPNGPPSSQTRARFEALTVSEVSEGIGGKFLRIGDNAWISAKDVRHPVPVAPPSEVDADAGERWIDVDLDTQTLVAFEGRKPVFATLVSTGKGKQGTPLATPKGVHRIWIKLLTSDMDNLEDDNASRYWRIEDVPWVQYFSKGVGLHGAFWHRSFGNVRSHGCVNLSPLDAQRLFHWTGPHLPGGWTAVLPTSHELGTVIRVR